jgi:isopentenyl-diphosphate delta-isomerase
MMKLILLANSFTPWFRLICRDLLFPWWDEMAQKSREKGWNPEKGVGKVDPTVLAGGAGMDKVLKMV